MGNIILMSDKPEIVRLRPEAGEGPQAADWLAKLDRGNLTAEEHAAFTRWLAENPKNKEAIKELAAFWYDLNAPLSQLTGQSASRASRASRLSPRRKAALPMRFRVAAAVLAIAALVVAPVYRHVPPSPEERGYFSTDIGETRAVTLADASRITLNTNSILEQAFSRKERVVRLISGEAIFDVAHDENRPFLVYAADSVVRAVGTRFAVRLEPDKVSVTVTEGRIALGRRLDVRQDPLGQKFTDPEAALPAAGEEALSEPLIVGQGEAGEIGPTAGAAKRRASDIDLAERLSWAEGRLVFYDRELQSVIEEVARYTPVTIRIDDETLRRKKISGILRIGDIDLMLDGLEGALDVEIHRLSPSLVSLTSG